MSIRPGAQLDLLSLCALAALVAATLAPAALARADVAPAAEPSAEAAPPPRLVHRFLRVEISPNAVFVASVEGDSPVGGYYPPVRDLIIRRIADGSAVRVELPWPAAPPST
jgi:hypothetical protein